MEFVQTWLNVRACPRVAACKPKCLLRHQNSGFGERHHHQRARSIALQSISAKKQLTTFRSGAGTKSIAAQSLSAIYPLKGPEKNANSGHPEKLSHANAFQRKRPNWTPPTLI